MKQSSTTPNVGIGLRMIVSCSLTPPRSAFLYLQFLARCHPYILLHFYTCFTNFLSRPSLHCSARQDAIRSTRATRTYSVHIRACVLCARIHGSCDVLCNQRYVRATSRSKRKSPRWTWILLSEGYYHTIQKAHHARK